MSRIEELRKIVSDAQAEIALIQSECVHPVSCVTKQYDGNTGNYDPSDNCYWINLHCELCEKKWSVYDNDKDDDSGYRAMSLKYKREIKK